MKKENRKMAQQRRAEERRKKAVRKKISTVLAVLIPLLALAALVAVVIIFTAPDTSGSSDGNGTETSEDSSGTDAADSTNTGTDNVSYSTDTSLTIENGDTVNIDYVGSIDGVEFAGGNSNGAGADLTIGSGRFIDNFEEQLIGAHPGDTVEVTATFPEDYGNEELDGKEAVFQVVINGIYK